MLVFLLPLPPLLFVQAYASFACLAQVPHVGVGVEGGTAHCLLYLGRVAQLGQQVHQCLTSHYCPPPPVAGAFPPPFCLVCFGLTCCRHRAAEVARRVTRRGECMGGE